MKGWVILGIVVCVGLLARCVNGGGVVHPAGVVNAVGDAYTGSEACGRCHSRIGDSYRHTAHAFASRPADKKFIKGSFLPGKNVFSFSDHGALPVSVEAVMEERDSGLFQTAYINGKARRSERFGVVVGSGRKAQSYLYWRGNQLLQLPVSYFSATDSWANSPGFPSDQVKFNRLIPAHCMECHSTVSELLPTTETIPGPNPPAFFDRSRMIYGIGCENCHGPGARHVAYESQQVEGKTGDPAEPAGHPGENTGRYIVNPAKLSRQQSLDLCAVCHSGIRESILPPFSFVAGDTLSRYFGPGPAIDTGHAEVHDNQYGLLAASKCFRASGTLECRTCHDTHGDEKGQLALFSQRCMNCHQAGKSHFCSRKPAVGEDITRNCIDCHMPVQASALVNLMVPGQKELAPLLVRSHLIAVYR
jgi:Cytochrome c554 and c-prime